MTCPNCGREWLRPYKHEPPVRFYQCYECGFRFQSVELVRVVAERQAFQASMFKMLQESD